MRRDGEQMKKRYEKCPDCKGKGIVYKDCSSCGGTGELNGKKCPYCSGNGKVLHSCSNCGGNGRLWN